MADAHPNPAVIAAVHAETSTGVRSDIAALGEIKGDALLIVDAVTLLGGYAGGGQSGGAGARTYHHTAPVAMVASLHAALRRILDEGLEQVWARHAEAGRILQTGLQELGLELFAEEGHRLPELTTVRVPDGVDSAAVRRYLLERHNLEIGAGAGQFASSVWRIGLMGHNARPDAALLVLAALEDAIKAAG